LECKPESGRDPDNALSINKSKVAHKRAHHFLSFMGNTIFSIRDSLMLGRKMLRVDRCIPKLERRTEAEGRGDLLCGLCGTLANFAVKGFNRKERKDRKGLLSYGFFVHVPLDGMLHEFAGAA
jgi:hypothetical protein